MAEEVVGSVGVEVIADDSKLKKQIPKMGQDVGKGLSNSILKQGAIIGAIGLSIKATFEGVSNSIKDAIDVTESEDFFVRAMGNMSNSVTKWSDNLQTKLGLNAVELRANTTTVFRMAEAMGVASKEAKDMGQELTLLSQDLASARNIRADEAFNKLTAALTGESEPLKRLGFVINETATKQEAYRTGIAAVGSELSEAQKVQARYALIMRLTSKEQGNFAATMDMGANLTRRLDTQMKIISQNVGKIFLPLFENVTRTLVSVTTAIAEVTAELGRFFNKYNSEQNKVESGASDNTKAQIKQADAINKVTKATKKGVAGFDEFNQLQTMMADTAEKATDEIITQDQLEGTEIQPTVDTSKLKEEIEKIPTIFDVLVETLGNVVKSVGDTWNGIIKIITSAGIALFALVTGDANLLGGAIKFIFIGILETIKGAVTAIFNVLKAVIVAIGGVIVTLATGIVNVLSALLGLIAEEVSWFASTLWEMITMVFQGSFDFIKKVVGGIGKFLIAALKTIGTGISIVLGGIFNVFKTIFTGIFNVTKSIWDGMVNVITGAVNLIIDAINAVINAWNKLKFEVPEINIGGQTFGGFEIGVPKVSPISKIGQSGGGSSPTISSTAGSGVSNANTPDILSLFQQLQSVPQQSTPQEAVFVLNDREVARGILPALNRENSRIGNRTIIQTVGAR